jgi:hypothetical protein
VAVLILVAFIVLAVIYTLVTPPLEAGDESRHYAVVKYLVDSGRLPIQNIAETAEFQLHWSHEGNQPPLYYALAASLTFWIETGRWAEVFWYNPHTSIGNPLRPDNKNIIIHPPGASWPWRGHVLAVHLIRFLSIGMAAITIVTAYCIALNLFRGHRWPACGAMAVAAFNPMFIFISAAVNNDNAVIMFITLALWLMIRMSKSAVEQATNATRPSSSLFRSTVLLGFLIGLGALSKLYALGLLPLASLLFIWLAYRTETMTQPAVSSLTTSQSPTSTDILRITFYVLRPQFWYRVLTWNVILLLVFLAVAGWFYVRNTWLYDGDFLALQVMRETAGQRREAPSLATLWAEFEGFRIAYWALFGGVNILAADWIYTLLDWVSLVALLGLVAFIIRFTIYDLRFTIYVSPFTFFLLLAWTVIMVTGFIVWNLTQPAGQGRLLYPAIAAISALGVLGLTWWLPMRAQKIVLSLGSAALFLFATLSPWIYIAPAYARPALLTEADLPAGLQRVDFIYAGRMHLIGYQLHTDTIRPAENLKLTLYWRLLRPVKQNYSIFVHILGRQRQVISQLDTYPGGGRWPTSLLPPGQILADHYTIPIPPEAEFSQAPTRLLIAAGIYDFFEPGRPGQPVTTLAGQPAAPLIASARLIPWQWPNPPQLDNPVNFSGKATLLSYQLAEDQQTLTLNWRADSSFETDYTVFIQAWRMPENKYTDGFDGPPVGGDYPTSLWKPGEIIIDTHLLDLTRLSPGTYNLLIGLYNPNTGERLPTSSLSGPLPDHAVHAGTLRLSE